MFCLRHVGYPKTTFFGYPAAAALYPLGYFRAAYEILLPLIGSSISLPLPIQIEQVNQGTDLLTWRTGYPVGIS